MPPLLEVLPVWGIRDPFSMGSHLLGAVLSVAATVALVRRARQAGLRGAAVRRLLLYGLTLVAAFSASALFHFFDRPPEELVFFKKLDHAAIFLLIAGTATALYGMLEARWTARLIGLTWLVALVALVVKMVVWPMALWETALVYLAVGWTAAVGIVAFVRTAGWRHVGLLGGGTGAFSLGAVIFAMERPVLWLGVIEGHELFHLLVLAGAALFYVFIYRHATVPAPFATLTPEAAAALADFPIEVHAS